MSLLLFGVETSDMAIDRMAVKPVAALSVRLLRIAYHGPCLRVRRSSDDAELDIGFVSRVLDTTALTAFVGANDGFVTTWHDQSGFGKHFTQATASAQPKIVSSGSILTGSNSKPVIRHDGSDDSMFSPTSLAIVSTGIQTGIHVAKNTGVSGERHTAGIRSTVPPATVYSNRAAGGNRVFTSGRTATFTYPTDFEIQAVLANGSSAQFFRNGGSDVMNAGTFAESTAISSIVAFVGEGFGSAGYSNAQFHEWIIWNSGLSAANLNLIGNDMASYYGLPWSAVS